MSEVKLAKLGILCLLFIVSASLNASAASPATPETGSGTVKVISPSRARSLLRKAFFFDARKSMNFGKGHLPGAVMVSVAWESKKIPILKRVAIFDASKLPDDKAAHVVFYSHGITGWKSYHAARVAVDIGYTNVSWMREGMSGWKALGYPVEE